MPAIITCPHCQRQLRLPEEFLGRPVRCSSCQQVFTASTEPVAAAPPPPPVPAAVPPPPDSTPAPAEGIVLLREEWLTQEGESSPRRAREREPFEDDRPARRPGGSRRRRDDYDDEDEDYRDSRPLQSDRSGTILVLGILSIVLCCAPLIGFGLGVTAMNMANNDLRAMSYRRMNPAGRGSTQTGKICGIVGMILSGCMFLLAVMFSLSRH